MGQPQTDALLHQVESLKILLSRLGEASRRVSEYLDVNVVLQEVIDNARYLTGARYGVLLTYEASGSIKDFVTSGLSPEEIERIGTLPRGPGLLGHLNEIREPLRLTDIGGHRSSVGFPEKHPPMKTSLGMTIRHLGEHVGNIYLTEKDEERDFTSQDEEILVLFGAQAGAAIFNARKYHEVLQARADLEALLNISPVGVLVFDGKTGDLVSANDETRRLVGEVKASGPSLSQLLEVMPLRRADGSDIPIEDLPTVKALTRGETVLADELVIHPPDGRPPIAVLVNARPIRREGGDVSSVVATIQDISQLEEMKRQRAEFLERLSNRLRTPLSAIKGAASTLLGTPHLLDPDETRQFLQVIDEQSDEMRQTISDLVDMTHIESGTLSVNPEPAELPELLEEAREAHAQAVAASDSVDLDLTPGLPRVLADRRRILQVLDILIMRATRHSPMSSGVTISAELTDEFVAVSVNVRISREAAPRTPGHGNGLARAIKLASGAGHERTELGLAICEGLVEAHGGRISLDESGEDGSERTTFTIPVVDESSLVAEQQLNRSVVDRNSVANRVRILAVGGNPETLRHISNTLSRAGLIALATGDPDEAERIIEDREPDVVILEPMLPGAEGFEMLTRAGRISDAPIIFVAGRGWERQTGRAFELGAFDYIAKPFTSIDLLARIDIALRRRSTAAGEEISGQYLHGDLSIDYAARQVTVAGRAVSLTATEYKLVAELSAASGRVLTHQQLLRRVWGPLYSTDPRIVRTYVKELRYKLGDDATSPRYIFTELGVGYRMARTSAG